MSDRPLISLKDHNSQRLAIARVGKRGPRPNGIACPKCNSELFDSYPDVTLTSRPPKKDVHCEACGFRDYRYA